jgi:hypothetical protein
MPKLSARPSVAQGLPRFFKPSASRVRDSFLTFADKLESLWTYELVVVLADHQAIFWRRYRGAKPLGVCFLTLVNFDDIS